MQKKKKKKNKNMYKFWELVDSVNRSTNVKQQTPVLWRDPRVTDGGGGPQQSLLGECLVLSMPWKGPPTFLFVFPPDFIAWPLGNHSHFHKWNLSVVYSILLWLVPHPPLLHFYLLIWKPPGFRRCPRMSEDDQEEAGVSATLPSAISEILSNTVVCISGKTH